MDEGHIISMADGIPILGEGNQTISANNVFEVRTLHGTVWRTYKLVCGVTKLWSGIAKSGGV